MKSTVRTSPLIPLKRAHLASRGVLDRALSTVGMSLAQFGVLRLLDEQPGMSGAELARRSSVTAPTMNEIVATLERGGLITRRPAPEGRSLLAHLTPAGQVTMARCVPVIAQVHAAIFDWIDPQQLDAFTAVLDQIADASDAFDEGSLS